MVPNGIADYPLQRTHSVDTEPPLLVMVARFAPQKDHSTLLRALAELLHLDWQLQLVGAGELQPAISAQLEKRGLAQRVTILPPETDVASLLMKPQLFILTTNIDGHHIEIASQQ